MPKKGAAAAEASSSSRRRRAVQADDVEEQRHRVAIVDAERCKPSRCNQECKKNCPANSVGKFCVEVGRESQSSRISESLCIGCGICVRRCPFDAIRIIKVPGSLAKETVHRYGLNGFKLHRLPMPRPGQVLGMLGSNGMGKSTALGILAGRLKPNFGRPDAPPDWKAIVARFRGGSLQAYFTRLLEDEMQVVVKPQFVERIPEQLKTSRVDEVLARLDSNHLVDAVAKDLEISHLMDRKVAQLSGGELQRFMIAGICVQAPDVSLIDEPSAYLDVRQRLRAARSIRELLRSDSYVVVVEHDLAVLEYISDFVCCLWGSASGYGVITMPFAVREGINIFLAGFIPTENLRFREEPLTFRRIEQVDADVVERLHRMEYPNLVKTLGGEEGSPTFRLDISAGSFASSEIIVMLGENGTGKTTFIQLLAGRLTPDDSEPGELLELSVSYKPQTFQPTFKGTVRELLMERINGAMLDPQFQSDVARQMQIDEIADLAVPTLSGGQLQRVALVLALGKPADIYLIDEPSAYLDVEQRVAASRAIKRFILHTHKTAFVVEHDFLMATYLADRVIVYDGLPGKHCSASAPMPLLEGLNKFLAQLDVTFRRDQRNFRPRINKFHGIKDREQKQAGTYFLLED